MSGKRVKTNSSGVRETTGPGKRPGSARARRDVSGNSQALQGSGSSSDAEIRDLLGNFSEQVGAYFG